jgi:hypothetical protein
MHRRKTPDPLQPSGKTAWLVIRNRLSEPLAALRLEPGAQLRVALETERARRLAAGWICDDIGRACSFFFCQRGDARELVAIETREPSHSRLAPPR